MSIVLSTQVLSDPQWTPTLAAAAINLVWNKLSFTKVYVFIFQMNTKLLAHRYLNLFLKIYCLTNRTARYFFLPRGSIKMTKTMGVVCREFGNRLSPLPDGAFTALGLEMALRQGLDEVF